MSSLPKITNGIPNDIRFGWWVADAKRKGVDTLRFGSERPDIKPGVVLRQASTRRPRVCQVGMHQARFGYPEYAYYERSGGFYLTGVFGRGDTASSKECGDYRMHYWRCPDKKRHYLNRILFEASSFMDDRNCRVFKYLKKIGAPVHYKGGLWQVDPEALEYEVYLRTV